MSITLCRMIFANIYVFTYFVIIILCFLTCLDNAVDVITKLKACNLILFTLKRKGSKSSRNNW